MSSSLAPGRIDLDPSIMVSPCDGIVGGHGQIEGVRADSGQGHGLHPDGSARRQSLVEHYRDGSYVTLRLTSAMYHRFHAPYDLRVEQVNYKSGDTWNTNPIALKRVEKLYCKNERAILRTHLRATGSHMVTLVPVAAILVASIRLHCLDVLLHLAHQGPNVFRCDASYRKGEEMGWFEHGSTIIVFAPKGFSLCEQDQPRPRGPHGRAALASALGSAHALTRPERLSWRVPCSVHALGSCRRGADAGRSLTNGTRWDRNWL